MEPRPYKYMLIQQPDPTNAYHEAQEARAGMEPRPYKYMLIQQPYPNNAYP